MYLANYILSNSSVQHSISGNVASRNRQKWLFCYRLGRVRWIMGMYRYEFSRSALASKTKILHCKLEDISEQFLVSACLRHVGV